MGIKWIHIEGWKWVKEAALTTIHKSSIEGKEITTEWKMGILKSEHSPIRELSIRFKYEDIMRWIADQLVRHNVGVNNFMGTGRSDRGNKPRSEQTMEDMTVFMQSLNAQSFINEARTRLCIGCVSKETRLLMEHLVDEVSKIEPEVAFYCVPPCIYQCGCKESAFTKCNHFKKFIDANYDEGMTEVRMFDIDERYRRYHNYRSNLAYSE